MPNSVAEAYLFMLRSSMIPGLGEAMAIAFNQQIEVDEWNWKI